MTGTFLKVLMAASALVPATATAQRIGADVGVNVDARAERGDRWIGRDRRDDRAAQDAPRQRRTDVATAAQARGDVRIDQTRRDDRQGYGQYGLRDGRDGRQAYRNDRRDDDRRFQNGQTYRGYGTAQGYRGGYDNRGTNRWDNRGQWNRGWRSDNRYDWSDYRASNRGAYRLPRYYAPSGWGSGYRRFGVGFTLSSVLFNRNYWIQDPYTYRLPEAYGPYRWVRYYDDALLVDLDSGRVVDTVYGIFW